MGQKSYKFNQSDEAIDFAGAHLFHPSTFANNNNNMTNPKALRTLVILEWIFIFAAIILSTTLENQLPMELKQWIDMEMEMESEFLTNDIVVLIGLPWLIVSIAGSIGLYRLRKWGAWAFLTSMILGYALFPFAGPTVEHAFADMIDEISVIIAGMIMALAFFTDTLSANQSR